TSPFTMEPTSTTCNSDGWAGTFIQSLRPPISDRGADARRLRPDGALLVVGSRTRVRRGTRVVRIPLRLSPRARISLVHLRRRGAGRAPGGADPAVHRGVRGR